MSGEPMILPGQASTVEAPTSTTAWVEHSGHYAAQGVVEHDRRFRNTSAPRQRGAIDDPRTIARDEGASQTRTRATSSTREARSAVQSTPAVRGTWSSATLVHQLAPRHGGRTGLDSAGPVAIPQHARTVRTVFPQPSDGYAAVGRLREVGFRIDLEGSIDGDLIVTIQAGRTRFDELASIVARHQGRIEARP